MVMEVRRRTRPTAPPGITIPRRRRGGQSDAAVERFAREVAEFCARLQRIASRLDFKVSARGWCYLLEEDGLGKGDFNAAHTLINDCRKDGHLPVDFVAVDQARTFDGEEYITGDDAEEAARDIIEEARAAHALYTPHSFWDDKDVYIQALVEKIVGRRHPTRGHMQECMAVISEEPKCFLRA